MEQKFTVYGDLTLPNGGEGREVLRGEGNKDFTMNELSRLASDFAFQIDASSVNVTVEDNYEDSCLHIIFSNEEGEKLEDWTCFPKTDFEGLRDELEGLIDDASTETDALKDKYMVESKKRPVRESEDWKNTWVVEEDGPGYNGCLDEGGGLDGNPDDDTAREFNSLADAKAELPGLLDCADMDIEDPDDVVVVKIINYDGDIGYKAKFMRDESGKLVIKTIIDVEPETTPDLR